MKRAIHAGYRPGGVRVVRPRVPGVRAGAGERAVIRDAVLARTGIRGLNGYCDNAKAQAGVSITMGLLETIGGAMATGSGTSASVGKTGAGLVSGVGDSLTSMCTGTQGQTNDGALNAPAGSSQIDALVQSQQNQMNMLMQQQQQQQLNLQQQQTAGAKRTQQYMLVGGIAALALVAVVVLRRK